MVNEANVLAKISHLERELQEVSAARDRYRNALSRKLVRDAVDASLERHGGSRVLRPHVERQVRMEEDADGSLRIVAVDDRGRTVAVDEIVQAMRIDPDYARAFRANEVPSRKLANNPWTRETWHLTTQARLLRENPGLARRLQREAGVLHDDTPSRKRGDTK